MLAGDGACVVAPSSGEGIHYAMVGGRVAATAATALLKTGRVSDLAPARKLFLREHGQVFRVLRVKQDACCKSDERRERFVSPCHDLEVRKLTFGACINKKLVGARALAHIRIGFNNFAHPWGPRLAVAHMTDLIPAWVNGILTPVEKLEVHRRGLRHKAVSVFVLQGGRVLIQQRAMGKYHTPGLWANTCCTHPGWDEASADCALRRLEQELGITGLCPAFRDRVEYRAEVGSGLTEHEVVDVFVAQAPEGLRLTPDPAEVMAVRWVGLHDLGAQVARRPAAFTPWLRIYMADHKDSIFRQSGPGLSAAKA